ncbi:alpha/beta fold hydrolase [Streptomonospora wellingtoniae]|uniref:Alpha/beta hydrolase n=1 Tax=Streptomonospora wellingtoniae TaxID=3075544 RepID=A0ABU2KQE6_9ACTN|nr:alpha/beta hydrolase [Streptomonospora sp. DSM 45055]MDT0301501.1 alpha/beta hydrolase [Streptomonospora sp. DSM 45055]
MTEPTIREPETRTVDAPGATIRFDVRGDLGGATAEAPVLMMVGSPMEASGFTTLAGYFGDRPVVTYDPRGVGRSPRTDGASETTPQEHAEDLRRVIGALGVDRVDLFGSSGGALNGLVLVSRHPERVRTLVAHEPPVAEVLPDREQITAVCEDIYDTYHRSGMGPAMAKFIALVQFSGPLPADYPDRPAPDPAQFGLPTEDDGSRDDPLLGQNIRNGPANVFDYDALAAAPTRIVLAAGRESAAAMPGRAAFGVAERLGVEPVVFPSHHGGFMSGEFGMEGEPEAFAATLREVLSRA